MEKQNPSWVILCKIQDTHKTPKYSDTWKNAVIILKFEQCGSSIV